MKKLYENYQLDNGITAKISPSEITLKNHAGKIEFVFKHSKPDVVEMVAFQMLAAIAISKKQRRSEFEDKEDEIISF